MSDLHDTDYQLKLKRGLAANINATVTKNAAVLGEPHFTSDTFVLYISTGETLANIPVSSQKAYVIKSAAYTLTDSDATVEVTTVGATQTLPTAVGRAGREFRVINCSGGVVQVATTSSQTIGNLPAGNPIVINLASEEWLDVISNGTNWRII